MEMTTTQELLAQAEKLCSQRNVRLTPQRLEVLRLMSLREGAISAYDSLIYCANPNHKPNHRRFIVHWIFCWSRDLYIRWNPPTAMYSAICLISRPIRLRCLFAIVVAR